MIMRLLFASTFLLLSMLCFFVPVFAGDKDTLWLRKVDLTRATQDWNLTPKAALLLEKEPLSIAGRTFSNGLSSHTEAALRFELDGKADNFYTLFGIDDRTGKKCRVVFSVKVDDKVVYKSPVMKRGSKPVEVKVDLTGGKRLWLILENEGTGVYKDRANYANAFISYEGKTPVGLSFNYIHPRSILTPPDSPKPRINGAKVYGVRPGHPFLFTIAATGERPMSFTAENLPEGLSLDKQTGIITGETNIKGESLVKLTASNKLGTASRELKIVVGDKIALTPPMGWNGYNRYADSIDHRTVKEAVDAMVSSGLINYGWSYINIDDSWSVKPGSNDSLRGGEPRGADGRINSNRKFPDMKEFTDYIHSKGFKAGLYSSPGKLTCSGYTASYEFEEKDAQQWADWGFDYIKYDYCTYREIAPDGSVGALKKPYGVMRAALDKVNRDIVYSMSQYGMGDVWKWGEEVGGNSWRTTHDLIDTWHSLSVIGFSQDGLAKYAGPGHWNDPDMLVVGLLGWGEIQYPSRLFADEQYTHISLWSLLASPLLIGCDIGAMDEFTRSLLTNHEVIDINQDPLGKQASRVYQKDSIEIWCRPLEDGSIAVGLFNRNETTRKVEVPWSILNIIGKQIVRDVWRQRDEGNFSGKFSAMIPAHGVKFITIKKLAQ